MNINCKTKGVPRRKEIYIRAIKARGLNLDIRHNATIMPRGNDPIKATANIIPAVPSPPSIVFRIVESGIACEPEPSIISLRNENNLSPIMNTR